MLKHDTLLLASGSSENRREMHNVFAESYNLLESGSSEQTIFLMEQNIGCIAAVLLDISVPEKVDLSVLNRITTAGPLKNVPVVVMVPPEQPEAVAEALLQGAIEAMTMDSDPVVLARRVQNITELTRHKWHLEEMVAEQTAERQHANDTMVDVLSSIIEYRSVESGQHILRIRHFTRILLEELARSCPRYELTEQTIKIISNAAALHDIGKISIPDAILNKPGPLNARERLIMQEHSAVGSGIIRTLGEVGDKEYLRYAYNICRHHHERWDGSGYPDGLAGDNIPVCAQVVGLADAYDALTTKRVYKDAVSCELAAAMIYNGECGAFSPSLLECFRHVSGKFAELAQYYADGNSPKAENIDTELPVPSLLEEQDILQLTRAKYQMLLHYVDAAVIEVDLNQGVYHVVYNPDPGLDTLRSGASLMDLEKILLRQARTAEEKAVLRKFRKEDIPRFLRDGLMRMQVPVTIYDRITALPRQYIFTVLRQSLANREQKNLILVLKPMDRSADKDAASQLLPRQEEFLIGCEFRNDNALTLLRGQVEISALLGYGKHPYLKNLCQRMPEEDRYRVQNQIADQLSRGKKLEAELRLLNKNGKIRWVLCKCRLEISDEGQEIFRGILIDITSTKNAEIQMRRQLERYQIILSQTENVMFEWDMETDSAVYSDNWEDLFGYPPIVEKLTNQMIFGARFHPEDRDVFVQCLQKMREGSDFQICEVRVSKADGRYLWCRFRNTAMRDEQGKLKKIVGIIINIDEEKKSIQALQDRAERDVLTKLLNKNAARQRVEACLSTVGRNSPCALIIIDMDNFKYINDNFGHLFGDVMLTQVANEIRRLFRTQDVIARIGGDEFLVLMRGVSDRKVVENRCIQLRTALHNLMRDHLRGGHVSCSIGVALYPQHGSNYSDLFHRADQALYQAKNRGKDNYAIFDLSDTSFFSYQMPREENRTAVDSQEKLGMSENKLIEYVFRNLYESADVETSIRDILAVIGQQLDVSRVYIFENSEDDRFCFNTFEWCSEGIPPQRDILQNISYETDVPSLLASFDEQGLFYCPDVSKQTDDLREILQIQGIQSLLLCSMRDKSRMWGYIGFDECRETRYWTKEQIQTIRLLSENISVFLMKKRLQDKLEQFSAET